MKFLILLFCFPLSASEIWLRVGESRTFQASPSAVVRIGARGIVRAVDTDQGVQVVGLKPGATPFTVDGKSYMLRVSFSSQKEFQVALRQMMEQMLGLKLYSDENQLYIRGTLLRFSDWKRIADLATKYQGEFAFKAGALSDVAEEALKHFKSLSDQQAIPVVRFSANPQFTVHVPKAASSLKSKVERVFAPYGIAVEVSESTLAVEPLIKTRVVLAEVSKSFSQEFGVKWPSEYTAQVLPRMEASEGLLATLKVLEAQGQAQILASPVLLCRSGGSAKFHAGGEFPIRMIGRNTRDVIWKQHGVILNVKPLADFGGSMSLEIETEISLLDHGNAVDGIPALKTNSVKSHFDIAGKRTIALSGLLRQELGQSSEGLPLLSGIPVIGALFSSKKFVNNQSELVVFVTPEVHSPESDTAIQMPEGWIQNAR